MSKLERIVGKTVKIIEKVSPKKAADFTFYMFSRTEPRKMLEDEVNFYNSTEHYTIPGPFEKIKIYTKGPENGDVFILLHGWNSNLARLSNIADILVEQGYRCLLFDMPAHGQSKQKITNLKYNSLTFEAVLKHLGSEKELNVLTHSFGSMTASFTLSNTNYKLNNLIFLTALDRLQPIFDELKSRIDLSDKVYDLVIKKGNQLLKEKIADVEMLEKTKKVNFKKLSIFHDKYDRILALSNSEKLATGIPGTNLFVYERIGHSKMLQNEGLLNDLKKLVKRKTNETI